MHGKLDWLVTGLLASLTIITSPQTMPKPGKGSIITAMKLGVGWQSALTTTQPHSKSLHNTDALNVGGRTEVAVVVDDRAEVAVVEDG